MARNVLHLGAGQVTTTVLTILWSAAIARTLGASDYGLLYLLMSIATFAYVVVDWGHGPYVIRETARHPVRSGELLGSALAVRAAMALMTCVAAVATTWLFGYDLRTRLLAAALILAWLPQYLGLSFGWIFRGHERMDRDALLNVVLKLATLILSMACLALGGRLVGLVLVWSAAGLITFGFAIVTYRRLHLPAIHSTVSVSRELIRDGAPMLAMSLAVAVEPYFNANILYKLVPAEVVGWYGASWNIAGTLVAPAMILGATMYPRLSTAASNPAEFKRALHMSFRPLLLVAVLGAVGTYLFADVAIAIIYSRRKFGAAAENLRAFAPVLLLMYIDLFFSHAILALGKAGRLASVKVGAVLVTIGLELVLIPVCQTRLGNGGTGVMYSMAAGEFAMVGAAMWLIREVIDRPMIGDLCRGLMGGVGTVLMMRWLPPLTPFLAIPICVLAFMALTAAVGLVRRSDVETLVAGLRQRSTPVIESVASS